MSNRTAAKSDIVTLNIPSVTNGIMNQMLNEKICDNVVFKEDVAASQTSALTNTTVDFTGKDRIELTRTGGALNITVNGLADGQIGWLLITKTSGKTVSFANCTDIAADSYPITNTSTVLYEIIKKGSLQIARPVLRDAIPASTVNKGIIEIATAAEAAALTSTNLALTPSSLPINTTTQYGIGILATAEEGQALTNPNKAITPATIPISSTTQKGVIEIATAAEVQAGSVTDMAVTPNALQTPSAWIDLPLEANWSGNLKYFIDNLGLIHISGNLAYSVDMNSNTLVLVSSATLGGLLDFANNYIGVAIRQAIGSTVYKNDSHVFILDTSTRGLYISQENPTPIAGGSSKWIITINGHRREL